MAIRLVGYLDKWRQNWYTEFIYIVSSISTTELSYPRYHLDKLYIDNKANVESQPKFQYIENEEPNTTKNIDLLVSVISR